MSNKFYSPGTQRAEKVHELFDTIARRYDLMNDVMSFGMHRVWKKRTVRLALRGMKSPLRVLDLCCGTGDQATADATRTKFCAQSRA